VAPGSCSPAGLVVPPRRQGLSAQVLLPASVPVQQPLRFPSPSQHQRSIYISSATAAAQCNTGVTRAGFAAPSAAPPAVVAEPPQPLAGISLAAIAGARFDMHTPWHRKTVGVPSKAGVQRSVCCDQKPHSFARSVSPVAASCRGPRAEFAGARLVRLPRPSAASPAAAGRGSTPVAMQVGLAAQHIGQTSRMVPASSFLDASPLAGWRLMPTTSQATSVTHIAIPVKVEHCGHAEGTLTGEPSHTRHHQGCDRVEPVENSDEAGHAFVTNGSPGAAHVQQLQRFSQLPRLTPPAWQGPLPKPDSPARRQPSLSGDGQAMSWPQVQPEVDAPLPVLLPRRASGSTMEAACPKLFEMHTKITEIPSSKAWSTTAAHKASHEQLTASCDSVLSSRTLPPGQAAFERPPTEAQAAFESPPTEAHAQLSASCKSSLSTKTLPPGEAAGRRSDVKAQLHIFKPCDGSDDLVLSLETSSSGSAASPLLLEDLSYANSSSASVASPDAASRAGSVLSQAPSAGPPECQLSGLEEPAVEDAPPSLKDRTPVHSSANAQEEQAPSTTCVPMPTFFRCTTDLCEPRVHAFEAAANDELAAFFVRLL